MSGKKLTDIKLHVNIYKNPESKTCLLKDNLRIFTEIFILKCEPFVHAFWKVSEIASISGYCKSKARYFLPLHTENLDSSRQFSI